MSYLSRAYFLVHPYWGVWKGCSSLYKWPFRHGFLVGSGGRVLSALWKRCRMETAEIGRVTCGPFVFTVEVDGLDIFLGPF